LPKAATFANFVTEYDEFLDIDLLLFECLKIWQRVLLGCLTAYFASDAMALLSDFYQ